MMAFVRLVILRLDRLRRHVQRDRVDVGEDRDGALVEDRRDAAHVGDRGRDDLVPGSGSMAATAQWTAAVPEVTARAYGTP